MNALQDIADERARQVTEKGFDKVRDDRYVNGELAMAAGAYCQSAAKPAIYARKPGAAFSVPMCWPLAWSKDWWKPKDSRRDLVRAGALIVAEIERLDRRAGR